MACLSLIHLIIIVQTIIILTLFSAIMTNNLPSRMTNSDRSRTNVEISHNLSRKWCNGPLKFLDPPLPLTALASFPGSGNTWARYLIQQASGYATGCIYNDGALKKGDFPGEGLVDKRVIAIKTHRASDETRPDLPKKYDRVVLLIRNPMDTMLAEFNRRKSEHNHTGIAPLSEFSGKKWTNYVESMIQKWEEFHMYFFDHYKPKQIHLLRYENLKTDLIPELRKLMNFLGVQMENEDCVFKSQEGSAKRNKP